MLASQQILVLLFWLLFLEDKDYSVCGVRRRRLKPNVYHPIISERIKIPYPKIKNHPDWTLVTFPHLFPTPPSSGGGELTNENNMKRPNKNNMEKPINSVYNEDDYEEYDDEEKDNKEKPNEEHLNNIPKTPPQPFQSEHQQNPFPNDSRFVLDNGDQEEEKEEEPEEKVQKEEKEEEPEEKVQKEEEEDGPKLNDDRKFWSVMERKGVPNSIITEPPTTTTTETPTTTTTTESTTTTTTTTTKTPTSTTTTTTELPITTTTTTTETPTSTTTTTESPTTTTATELPTTTETPTSPTFATTRRTTTTIGPNFKLPIKSRNKVNNNRNVNFIVNYNLPVASNGYNPKDPNNPNSATKTSVIKYKLLPKQQIRKPKKNNYDYYSDDDDDEENKISLTLLPPDGSGTVGPWIVARHRPVPLKVVRSPSQSANDDEYQSKYLNFDVITTTNGTSSLEQRLVNGYVINDSAHTILTMRSLNRYFNFRNTTPMNGAFGIWKWILIGVIVLIPLLLLPIIFLFTRSKRDQPPDEAALVSLAAVTAAGAGTAACTNLDDQPSTSIVKIAESISLLSTLPVGNDPYLCRYLNGRRRGTDDHQSSVISYYRTRTNENESYRKEPYYHLSARSTLCCRKSGQLFHTKSGLIFNPIVLYRFNQNTGRNVHIMDGSERGPLPNQVYNPMDFKLYERCWLGCRLDLDKDRLCLIDTKVPEREMNTEENRDDEERAEPYIQIRSMSPTELPPDLAEKCWDMLALLGHGAVKPELDSILFKMPPDSPVEEDPVEYAKTEDFGQGKVFNTNLNVESLMETSTNDDDDKEPQIGNPEFEPEPNTPRESLSYQQQNPYRLLINPPDFTQPLSIDFQNTPRSALKTKLSATTTNNNNSSQCYESSCQQRSQQIYYHMAAKSRTVHNTNNQDPRFLRFTSYETPLGKPQPLLFSMPPSSSSPRQLPTVYLEPKVSASSCPQIFSPKQQSTVYLDTRSQLAATTTTTTRLPPQYRPSGSGHKVRSPGQASTVYCDAISASSSSAARKSFSVLSQMSSTTFTATENSAISSPKQQSSVYCDAVSRIV